MSSLDDPRVANGSVRLAGMRGVIAGRMTSSLQEAAQLTLHRAIDVSSLPGRESSARGGSASAPGVTEVLMTAVARCLSRSPRINATLEDGVITQWETVNLGIAVALHDGLMVPVIKNAHQLGVSAMADALREAVERTRGGRLRAEDVAWPTFTVSNLGGLGVDYFTPIINPPEVAILGIGRLRDGLLPLSLTIDHRAVDGAPGAEFLQGVEESVREVVGAAR